MKRIESLSNPRIRMLSNMIRKGNYSERWIVEGRTLFLDAMASGVRFDEVFVTPAMSQRLSTSLKSLGDGVIVYEIPSALMKSISTLETPPGILGIASRDTLAAPAAIRRFAALLMSLRDPGNLGTLARSAEAAGCEFLACSSDCAEPHQPKAVRASMGSLFRVPAFKVPDARAYITNMRESGITTYALVPRSGKDLYRVDLRYPSLILIGGETAGLPHDISIDEQISIPMKGRVESLNSAMAGTLCFYRFGRESG